MKPEWRLFIPLAAASLACALSAAPTAAPLESSGEASNETATEAPAAVATEAPTEAAEPGVVDPCTLLTEQEIASLLPSVPAPEYVPEAYVCNFTHSFDQGLAVAAAQGEQAHSLLWWMVESLVDVASDPGAPAAAEAAQAAIPGLPPLQAYQASIPFFELVGYTITPEERGDIVIYFNRWEPYNFTQVLAFQGDTMVLLGIRGLDRDPAQALMPPLAESLLGRVPASFTVSH